MKTRQRRQQRSNNTWNGIQSEAILWLGRSLVVALKRFSSTRARGPPIELDSAVRALDGRGQRAQVAGGGRGRRVGQLFGLRPGVQQLFLERVQLLHEMEVRVDVGLALQHHVVRLVKRQLPMGHQIGQHHGHRARYAGQTVHQDAFFLCSALVCKNDIRLLLLLLL